MRAIDKLYLSAFSAQADLVVPPPRNAKSNPELKSKLRFSLSGVHQVLIEDTSKPRVPYFPAKAPLTRRPTASVITHDEKGNLLVTTRTRAITWFTNDKSCQVYTEETDIVSPDDKLLTTYLSNAMTYCTADSSTLQLPPRRTIWSLGRGLSPWIEKIEKTESVPDGRVRIWGDGFFDTGDPGRWELVVEPKASYLVRSARFFSPGAKEPCITMENKGLITSEECQTPESATFF